MKTFNSKKSGVNTSDIDSSGALDIDGGGNVTIDSTTGSITLGATLTDGRTLKLGKNGATEMIFTPHGTPGSEKISLTNTAGDAADAIKLLSFAGGVTVDAGNGTVTFADNGASLGTITSSGYSGAAATAASATLATTVTVTDSTANTDFPVVFHNESNALLDDTAAFEYNPSTGTVTSTVFSGSGASLTTLNGSNISSGTVATARLPAGIYNTSLKAGRDASNLIDFATTDDMIIFRVNGQNIINIQKHGSVATLAKTTPSASSDLDGDSDEETVLVYNQSDKSVKQALFSAVCFLKGTKITLPDKSQKCIEDLTLEDEVLTYNIQELSEIRNRNLVNKWQTDDMKGEYSKSGIRNIWINPTDTYLVINDKLRVTKHHLIHFKRDNRYYFNFAETLMEGDELLTDKDEYERIETLEEVKENINVYNFELDKDQTYFAEKYLVHHYCKLCSGYANII